jgi:hypothetical protein
LFSLNYEFVLLLCIAMVIPTVQQEITRSNFPYSIDVYYTMEVLHEVMDYFFKSVWSIFQMYG